MAYPGLVGFLASKLSGHLQALVVLEIVLFVASSFVLCGWSNMLCFIGRKHTGNGLINMS